MPHPPPRTPSWLSGHHPESLTGVSPTPTRSFVPRQRHSASQERGRQRNRAHTQGHPGRKLGSLGSQGEKGTNAGLVPSPVPQPCLPSLRWRPWPPEVTLKRPSPPLGSTPSPPGSPESQCQGSAVYSGPGVGGSAIHHDTPRRAPGEEQQGLGLLGCLPSPQEPGRPGATPSTRGGGPSWLRPVQPACPTPPAGPQGTTCPTHGRPADGKGRTGGQGRAVNSGQHPRACQPSRW